MIHNFLQLGAQMATVQRGNRCHFRHETPIEHARFVRNYSFPIIITEKLNAEPLLGVVQRLRLPALLWVR